MTVYQNLEKLASATTPGAMGTDQFIVTDSLQPVKCVQTYQCGLPNHYLNGDYLSNPLDDPSDWTLTGFQIGATPPAGIRNPANITSLATVQEVAVAFAAVYNSLSAVKFVADTALGSGLLRFTAKTAGRASEVLFRCNRSPAKSTMTTSGRDAVSTRIDGAMSLADRLVWLALGDSITAFSYTNNYVATAASLIGLPAPAWYGAGGIPAGRVRNYALSGSVLVGHAGYNQMQGFDWANPSAMSVVNVATVMVGVNDFVCGNALGDVATVMAKAVGDLARNQSVAESLRWYLEQAKTLLPECRICLILPLQSTVAGGSTYTLQDLRNTEEALAIAQAQARHQNIEVWKPHQDLPLLDAANATYFSDGVHPTAACYTVLGEWVARKILGVSPLSAS